MHQIIITISPTGGATTEVVGFKGKGCEKLTEQLEAALGAAKGRMRKPEYHADERNVNQARK